MSKALSVSRTLEAITGAMALVLVVTSAILANGAYDEMRTDARIVTASGIARDLFTAMQYRRIEFGTVNTALVSPRAVDGKTWREIVQLRAHSTAALNRALFALAKNDMGSASGRAAIVHAKIAFDKQRPEIDAALLRPNLRSAALIAKWIPTDLNPFAAEDRVSAELTNEIDRSDPFIAEMVKIKQLSWAVRELAGNDRLLVGAGIASGRGYGRVGLDGMLERSAQLDGLWGVILEDANLGRLPPTLSAAVASANELYFKRLRGLRKTVIDAFASGKRPSTSGRDWIDASNPALKSLADVANTAVDLSDNHASEELDAARRNLAIHVCIMFLSLACALFAMLFISRRIARPMSRITETMRLVADGDMACELPFADRADEIGELSRALAVFRRNALEKQRVEDELVRSRIAEKSAEASNRLKSEFLATMSHELRTPLNAILGFSDILKAQQFGQLGNPRYRDYSEAIHSSGLHLLGLINDILDMSKLEDGKLKLHKEPVALRALISDCMLCMQPQAEKAEIRLFEYTEDGIDVLQADPKRLRQMLLNLLSNAVKFTPQGGQVRVSARAKDNGVAITVVDTGIGMEAADIPKAFERFGQIDSSLARKYEGTGLGLPLTKQLAKLHGASLSMESRPGHGTAITLFFPGESSRAGRQVA